MLNWQGFLLLHVFSSLRCCAPISCPYDRFTTITTTDDLPPFMTYVIEPLIVPSQCCHL